jgi:hypothetical protein
MFVQRWKASVRKPYIWAFVLLAIICSTIPALSLRYQSDTKLPIGLVNEDKGQLSYDLEAYMDRYDRLLVFKLDREIALRYLAMGRLEAVYIVGAGFTDRLSKGEYDGLITMYSAPATSSAVQLIETFNNKTRMVGLWRPPSPKLGNSRVGGIAVTPNAQQMYLHLTTAFERSTSHPEHIPSGADEREI